MFASFIHSAIEHALNLVARHEHIQTRLRPLHGRKVELVWSQVGVGALIEVDQDWLRVKPLGEVEADLGIETSLHALVMQWARKSGARGVPAGRFKFSGDIELAKRLSELLDGFEPDFERDLQARLGLLPGTMIARFVKSALSWGRDGLQGFAEDAGDYLRRSGMVVPGHEIAVFCEEVDRLRNATERLGVRLTELARRVERLKTAS